MCNINVIKRKDEYPDKKVNDCMNVLSLYSFASNSDGEGYISFSGNKILVNRDLNKIDYSKIPNSHFLMSHQRLSTSGFSFNNTHPHEGEHFILQHNGIFSGLGDKEKSDTRFYLEKLESEFKKSKNVIKAICETNKSVNGSYSIILFDKKTKKVYYYKNSVTSMHILEDKKYLVMSTVEKNVIVASMILGIKGTIKNVKHNNIYEITNKGLRYVAKFDIVKPKTTKINGVEYIGFDDYNYNDYQSKLNQHNRINNNTDYDDYMEYEKDKEFNEQMNKEFGKLRFD